jgi:hypothetical protein
MNEPTLYNYKVQDVVNVVDGDTYDLRISLGFGLAETLRFRAYGIDTPERYGKKASPGGNQATAFAQAWFEKHPNLYIRSYKGTGATVGIGDGAFGRWLADVRDFDTNESLTDALKAAGFAEGA